MMRLLIIAMAVVHTTLAYEEGYTCGHPFISTWRQDEYDPVRQHDPYWQWWAGRHDAEANFRAAQIGWQP